MSKNKSVLNTDSFDRRRYQEIRKMSKKLREIERMGSGLLPSFASLMGDIWAGLYKMEPRLKDKVDEGLEANKAIMERILNEDSFQSKRELTRLDDLMSAVGTIKFSEAVYDWLRQADENAQKAMQKAAEEARKEVEKARKRKKEGQGTEQGDSQEGAGDEQQESQGSQRQNGLSNAMQQVAQALQQQPDSQKKMLGALLQRAMQETLDTKEALESLVGGIQPGSGAAELKKVPLRDQIRLAEALSANQKLKQIAMWAGRFKKIAMKKQRSKHSESIERSGVTLGNQVERLLPMELAMYMSPATRLDFLRRFAEGQTMQYEQTGKEELGKGPIVLCLDQSGSMRRIDAQAKGFALALMSIARKQKRDFALILFSTDARRYVYPKGMVTFGEIINLATNFLDGGTDFEPPLNLAMETIQGNRFKKADIVFVTDGESHVNDEFLSQFLKAKKEKEFSVLSILLGKERTETVQKFSDRVVKASDFVDEKTHVAFEI